MSLIEQYQQYIYIEKSLSANTIEAYISDIQQFTNFLLPGIEDKNLIDKELLEVKFQTIQAYINFLYSAGIQARSQAREISALRSFFLFQTACRNTLTTSRRKQCHRIPFPLKQIQRI